MAIVPSRADRLHSLSVLRSRWRVSHHHHHHHHHQHVIFLGSTRYDTYGMGSLPCFHSSCSSTCTNGSSTGTSGVGIQGSGPIIHLPSNDDDNLIADGSVILVGDDDDDDGGGGSSNRDYGIRLEGIMSKPLAS